MALPLHFTGKTVVVRSMTPEDQTTFQHWLAMSEELRTLIDAPSIPTMEDQMRWLERSQEPDRCFFSILTYPEGVLIGNAGFVAIDREQKSAQFRITIGNPDSWGKGYGSEVLSLLLRFGFEEMGLERIWLRVLPGNTRAIRMYERAGLIPVGDDDGKIRMAIDRSSFLSRTV